MTNTSMAHLLFSKQDKHITEIINGSHTNKLDNNKSLKNKDTKRVNKNTGNNESDRDKKVSFKKVLDKEIKKQTGNKDKQDKDSTEELKKGKNIKPFYVVPKNKKNKEHHFIKADKKPLEKLLQQLSEEKAKNHVYDKLAENQGIINLFENEKAGKKSSEIVTKKLVNTINTVRERNSKRFKGPKLVVVDLREKTSAPKIKYSVKNKKLTKVKYDPKSNQNVDLKQNENLLQKEEIKLFTKSTDTDSYDVEVKTDVHNRYVPVKQPSTQFAKLQKNLSAELVKQAKLIIKDGGNGEIRLVLKPKTLGSVRVKVNIQDNNIVGKIFVDNNIVKELVESSLNNLYNAFKEEGFNQAMINVFVGSEKNQAQKQAEEFEIDHTKNNGDDFWNNDEAAAEEIVSADSLVNIVL